MAVMLSRIVSNTAGCSARRGPQGLKKCLGALASGIPSIYAGVVAVGGCTDSSLPDYSPSRVHVTCADCRTCSAFPPSPLAPSASTTPASLAARVDVCRVMTRMVVEAPYFQAFPFLSRNALIECQ